MDISIEKILWEALESENGLAVKTTSVDKFKRKCYTLRTKANERGMTAFNVLSFQLSPENPTGEIWIIKRTPNAKT